MFVKHALYTALAATLLTAPAVQAQSDEEDIRKQLDMLKSKIAELETRLAEQETEKEALSEEVVEVRRTASRPGNGAGQLQVEDVEGLDEALDAAENDPISIGGAVRFQYVYEDYNEGNRDRAGDLDFDIFRLDFNGEIGDVILSAQYRWFQYMDALRHAYFGYNFTEEWQGQIGIVNVPFGNLPYNSHNYFFSSNFYVGLEDEHDAGVRFLYRTDVWDFDIGFYKSDEQGGADSGASSRADKYSYDPVGIRTAGSGIYDEPDLGFGENNSWALRGVRKFDLGDDQSAELGASVFWGGLHDGTDDIGDQSAWAIHGKYNYDRWEFMGQISEYDYDMDIQNSGIVVGAYAYYDTIPTSATSYTANVAYSLPVEIGPITNLTFYNNYSIITDKAEYQEDTYMNVLGMALSAGGVYTYFDIVTAKNQPFVGGSMAGESNDTNTRFNINFGYYF